MLLRSKSYLSALERDSLVGAVRCLRLLWKLRTEKLQSLRLVPSYVLFSKGFLLSPLPLLLMPGIELDEDGSLDGSNDLTIRGRLLSLVEKVTYLKKKQAEKPVASDSRKCCKHMKGSWSRAQ